MVKIRPVVKDTKNQKKEISPERPFWWILTTFEELRRSCKDLDSWLKAIAIKPNPKKRNEKTAMTALNKERAIPIGLELFISRRRMPSMYLASPAPVKPSRDVSRRWYIINICKKFDQNSGSKKFNSIIPHCDKIKTTIPIISRWKNVLRYKSASLAQMLENL